MASRLRSLMFITVLTIVRRAIMFHIGVSTQHPPLPEPGQLSAVGIDFIKQCLNLDPIMRPTAAELKVHPWMIDVQDFLNKLSDDELEAVTSPRGGIVPTEEPASELLPASSKSAPA